MKSFLAALAFLTRIPIPHMEISEVQWKKSSFYFPFVGFIIGVLLYLFILLTTSFFSLLLQATLVLVLWVFLTGGLHLDGWMDVGDGLGSNQSKERIFEIMKDSRVGAMGVIAAFLLLLIKLAAIHDLLDNPVIFILVPILARLILLYAIIYFPYKGSLGVGLKQYLNKGKLIFLSLFLIGVTYLLLDTVGLLFLFLAFVISHLFIMFLYRRLDTLNGDCYGAIVEFVEAASLLTWIIIWGLFS